MFPARFYPGRMYAERFWPKVGADAAIRAYPTAVLLTVAPSTTIHGAPIVTVAPDPVSARQSVLVTTRDA